LLKRTAKIETQAGAALAKQKLVAKGKSVVAASGARKRQTTTNELESRYG
jgi:hypothetical protein